MTKEDLDCRVVTSRVYDATCQRMLANIYADIVAVCADSNGLGRLIHDHAYAIDDDGKRVIIKYQPSLFEEDVPPTGYLDWWWPDDETAPASALAFQKTSWFGTPPPIEHLPVSTLSGRGTGRLLKVGDAVECLAAVGARAQSRLSASMAGTGGYTGTYVDKVLRKITGRAVGYAIKTISGNVLQSDRRKEVPHFISTRLWEDDKSIGTHCGYAAYYRFRGRPALPYGEAKRREKERQRKRRKTNRDGKYKGGPKVYPAKRPRPSGAEYAWLEANKKHPVVATAKILNHKRGAIDSKIKEYLAKLAAKQREEVGKEIGKRAAQYLTDKVAPQFWNWVKKGLNAATERGIVDQGTLNTPHIP